MRLWTKSNEIPIKYSKIANPCEDFSCVITTRRIKIDMNKSDNKNKHCLLIRTKENDAFICKQNHHSQHTHNGF